MRLARAVHPCTHITMLHRVMRMSWRHPEILTLPWRSRPRRTCVWPSDSPSYWLEFRAVISPGWPSGRRPFYSSISASRAPLRHRLLNRKITYSAVSLLVSMIGTLFKQTSKPIKASRLKQARWRSQPQPPSQEPTQKPMSAQLLWLTMPLYAVNFLKNIHKTPHSSPVRPRYGVS